MEIIIRKLNPDGEISYEELIDGLRTRNEEEFCSGFSCTQRARKLTKKDIKCFLGGFNDFSNAPCEPELPILYFLVKLHLIYGIVKEIQKGRDQKANAL